MPAKFANGKYGQLEPNRLSGITFGNIEAQAPAYEDLAGSTPIAELENGMFLCVVDEPADGFAPLGRIAVLPGVAPANSTPYLVFSERKRYDERDQYSDFVDRAADKVDGLLYPRLVGLTPDSCVFTTNTVNAEPGSIAVGTTLYIGDDGYLATAEGTNTVYEFVVVKVYTMPDGQEGIKVMCRRHA